MGGWREGINLLYSKDPRKKKAQVRMLELISSRKTGLQIGRGGPSHSHSSDLPVPTWKKLQGWKWSGARGKKVQWQSQCGAQCKGKSQGMIILLRLWSTHKKGPSMTAPQKTQQAADRIRCRYLHPTNGQKQLTPAVELGKAEWSWRQPCRGISSLN